LGLIFKKYIGLWLEEFMYVSIHFHTLAPARISTKFGLMVEDLPREVVMIKIMVFFDMTP
jgi:hypothetical protein